ncbi:uncharacterized protein LOC123528960 [Mercenaria mercenaria]|uniref:uncharacterized protein LOC123528960 n=1 Tax=Mercenaria mercenaria TaxID=6596 RepID=UPI00234F1E2E|nr:uncharacterized protein LOC123528960 [Mercenaria mercenaria]
MKNSTISYVNQASVLTNATTQELKNFTTFSTDLVSESTVTTTQASNNTTTFYVTIATVSFDLTPKELEKSTTSFVSSTNKSTDGTTREMTTSKPSPITSAFESTNATTPLDTKSSKTFSENTLETLTILTGTTEQIRTESKGCPAGWLIYGSSCYFLSIQQATWSEAFIDCTSFGGYLVEINDAAEDQFLTEQVKRGKGMYRLAQTEFSLSK